VKCVFKTMVFVVLLLVASCEQGYGQAVGPINNDPPLPVLVLIPQPADPCIALQHNVNVAIGAVNSWNATLTQRRIALTAAQSRLNQVRSWRDLFWAMYAQQTTPMTDGQIMGIGIINAAIDDSERYVAQMQAQVNSAQAQVNAWAVILQNAQAAFNAAGC